MSTSNRLDLQTLGSQTVTTKHLPDHYSKYGIESLSYFAHLELDLNLIDLYRYKCRNGGLSSHKKTCLTHHVHCRKTLFEQELGQISSRQSINLAPTSE